MPGLDNKIPPPVVGALVAAGMWGVSILGPQFPLASVPKYSLVAVLVVAGLTGIQNTVAAKVGTG